MNTLQSATQAANDLLNNYPTLFNKFANREIQVNILAMALVQFSIDEDNRKLDDLESNLFAKFDEITKKDAKDRLNINL